jgi:hypothetical protein
MAKHTNRVAWGLAVVLGVMLAGPWRVRFDANPFNDRRFDRQTWLSGQGRRNPRGQMLQDVLDRRLRRGMTRESVIRLLGKPDIDPGDGSAYYLLGRLRAWEEDILRLAFDRQGRLTEISHLKEE